MLDDKSPIGKKIVKYQLRQFTLGLLNNPQDLDRQHLTLKILLFSTIIHM